MEAPWIAPNDGTDHFTVLPMELRVHIVSLLHDFRQVVQMSRLSRAWRDIHLHTPIVEFSAGAAVEVELAGLESALLRRLQVSPTSSKVDILRLSYRADDNGPRLRAHVNCIVALADARDIEITIDNDGKFWPLQAWTLQVPPSAEQLEVNSVLALTISGPGTATLKDLCLWNVLLHEWPCLPCLRSLELWRVNVDAPFSPCPAFPLLVDLHVWETSIQEERVDICFPRLKHLNLFDIDVSPRNGFEEPFGDVTIDAPELESLNVDLETECTVSCEFKSFTLRAPRLRCLNWHNQSAERTVIDVGRPPSNIIEGRIVFKWFLNEDSEKTVCEAQMMRMLRGFLPELSPERVADAVRSEIFLFLSLQIFASSIFF